MATIRRLEYGPTLPDDLDAALEENLYWILRNRKFLRKVELEETGVSRNWEPFVFRVHPELDPTKGVDEGWQRHAARTPRAASE